MAEPSKQDGTPSFEKQSANAETVQNQSTSKAQKKGKNAWQNESYNPDERPHVPARSTGLCAIASLLLVIASLFLIRFEMNRVGAFSISAGSYVAKDEVARIVGNPKGNYLPALDTEGMTEKIKALSPMVADVKFELSFTRRLKIRVIDERYRYCYRTESGDLLLLNSNFKALCYHTSATCPNGDCEYEKGLLTELYIRTPEEIVPGEVLSFEGKDELSVFVRELNGKKGDLYEKLNLLDIRNARHIVFIFDNLVCVELSEPTDLDIKCLALEKMMTKRKTREEEIETRFTYVDPVNSSIYWAVEEWANLYDDYPSADRP